MKQRDDLYMLPVGDPQIEVNAEIFEFMARPENNTLCMQVMIKDVEDGTVGHIQNVMMCLQHYPHLIEKMLFSFDFKFIEDEETEIALPEDTWKAEPVFYQWFQKLFNTPFALFFIADEDARFYALMADEIISGKLDMVFDERSGKSGIAFNEEQGKKLVQRLLHASLNLLHFCHYSNFDPRIYIEAMMASFDVQCAYEDLLKDYEHFVNNMNFKIAHQ